MDVDGMFHLFNIRTCLYIRSLSTNYELGGHRAALDSDDTKCIVGGYTRGGVSAYDATTGMPLWHRDDIRRCQQITFRADGQSCFVACDDHPAIVLDPHTGVTKSTISHCKRLYVSALAPLVLVEGSDLRIVSLESGATMVRIAKSPRAVLAACFSHASVFVSEAAGPVRAIRLADAACIWTIEPRSEEHYLQLAFNMDSQLLYGVRWEYANGTRTMLDYIDTRNGHIIKTLRLMADETTSSFALDGTKLVTAAWTVVDIASGDRNPLVGQ